MPRRSVDLELGSSRSGAERPRPATFDTTDHNTLMPHLVASQAAAFPNRLAVAAGSQLLTYREFDERANQIGHLLRSMGVGPDTLVGVCMDRSAALILAELGILKSGGTYVPLDPSYPQERLAYILNDAQPSILITQQRLADRVPAGKWRTIMLDTDASQIEHHSIASAENDARPENLAYVIYTSGSTGRPKGAQISHKNLLNLIFWHQRAFDVKPTDRASQIASPGFDAAVWETWPYLAVGASLHLPQDAIRTEPMALRDWLLSQSITIAFVPTPLAEHLIVLEWPTGCALRTLLTGADVLHNYPPVDLPFTLVNNYGPTECTVVTTSCTISPNGSHDVLPPIGRPISNVEIYILDERLRQVPIGVPGEIYIGGANVGRGYWNSPELTAAKFIANPFGSSSNGHLYRTGDLARFLPDGQISFLGRIDDQIKIRGYRIEPNEIVALLNEYPGVRTSAVVPRQRGTDRHLIAYLVLGPGFPLAASSLQDFLRQRLPEYMIPRVFVRLESMPLTVNGKVDKAMLPEPDTKNVIASRELAAPRTILERRLVEILVKLLGVTEMDVEDNFFLRGGHSLLAAQLIGSVRDTFGTELSLRTIFDSPTPAQLSAEIEKRLLARVDVMTAEEVRVALAESESI